MKMTRELMDALLDNTKTINELLIWKDQMYDIIGGLTNIVEKLGNMTIMLDEDVQRLQKEMEE